MSTSELHHKDSVLCRQDVAMNKVFIITAGTVKLYQLLPDGRRQITGFLGPGDLLGGIKRRQGAHCTAEAVTDVITCTFERGEFLEMVRSHQELSLALLITATDEIEAQHDHIVLLGRRSAPERLATFLLILAHRWKVDGEISDRLFLPMSRADIADYLGLTVETVSRTMTRLRDDGIIGMAKSNLIYLSNLAALYDIAGMKEEPVRGVAFGL